MSILGEHFFKTSNAIYSYGLGCRELAVYGYLRSHEGSPENAGDEGTIGAPIEAQQSGFDGERRSSGTSDFSPARAEMSGVELATTKAG